ncbi:MAG TPA: hypothetical protein VM221_06820 [Armatimonadota bacterium]|nr:hypothetical protein [Armatimonadota bacterium]
MAHLVACGVALDEVGFQTDNGSEYGGGQDRRGVPHGFKPTVEARRVTHNFIPPSVHTCQSDVETAHHPVAHCFPRRSLLHLVAKGNSTPAG